MNTTSRARTGAAELLSELGLLVDGPTRWGNPVNTRRPGVFVVELPGGADRAAVDIVAVRRWVERVPSMTIDGERATAHDVARRLEEWWLPGEPLLYVGRSARAVGPRLAAMYATPLGDAKPYSGGHWLKTLTVQRDMRVWWAVTEAHEEYEDALLSAVAARNDGRLPFANLAASDGGTKAHGLENSLLAELERGPAPPATKSSTSKRAPATTRRATASSASRSPRASSSKTTGRPKPPPTYLSREGMDRLASELEHLRTTVRPEVIARVKSARELGDLRENADYEYARKEQSFVEGRIQALEALMRSGEVVEDAAPSDVARLGSTVVVESDGDQATYVLVNSAESDPPAGRLSDVSPVGRALLGARAGDTVTVALPSGSVEYVVREVR